MTAALELRHISKRYSVQQGLFRRPSVLTALNDLSLNVMPGETLGLVGESGCGKSTAVNIMLGLLAPDEGQIFLDGKDIGALSLAARVRAIQPVFQDPYSSLNPMRRISDLVAQPLRLHARNVDPAPVVNEMLDRVGLPPRLASAFPAEISGGQRQRVAIARALVLRPKVLICDEPTSALDVSVQAQVINLLLELKAELGLTMVFVSHNLAVVEHLADRVAVMYLGEKVEEASVEDVFAGARHPYTRALLGATLPPEPGAALPDPIMGTSNADPLDRGTGCAFAPRCQSVSPACVAAPVPATELDTGMVRCLFPALST
ncbi:ATP-binding cassette domain-containing protein (plasmid) [Agrobacterium tumefaciens]|uniref:ATP-binding cassette domain-containing protein n=1 Tax=Agrobacterium tumefaciens TaxID=358 RepID=A0AAP9J9N8_AGRTU|nr:oligopeptide/dipeptide ABC transporter ATP-binding protein [Agrobacterium tumefaciens]NSZ61197.1 ATP-binding cassette domain-containing protein [Agrobacterium tumefaciens]QDY97606.1 ATP-binding cassette domain-containing protein [Agrobacterium tumefaciens]UXS12732.1 ATP-binding cassette domain-containing protein [Agrobacterium tumefaciens]UXS20094.1 ATP-binding cassette domain-containing protein [Agrobacterium tumefaciens]UXS27742.1 ATP-binding cassette domain-containing protein [Agrobacter